MSEAEPREPKTAPDTERKAYAASTPKERAEIRKRYASVTPEQCSDPVRKAWEKFWENRRANAAKTP